MRYHRSHFPGPAWRNERNRLESIDHAILIGAVVMTLGILLGVFSARFGVPFLLVFLAVGMLAGVDGPGGIRFANTWLSFLVGNIALAVILLDGGLRTRFATFRVALRPSLSLATVGVGIRRCWSGCSRRGCSASTGSSACCSVPSSAPRTPRRCSRCSTAAASGSRSGWRACWRSSRASMTPWRSS